MFKLGTLVSNPQEEDGWFWKEAGATLSEDQPAAALAPSCVVV